jgi:hypothetical protein
MPETKLEQSLAAAADTFEACITQEVKGDIEQLCGNKQRPYVVRELNAIPGHVVMVQVAAEGEIDP